MLVVCGRCDTEYEFDDALLSERGTTVKCTNCGYQFRVRPPRGVRATHERWVVRKVNGSDQVFGSLRDLRKAIDERTVGVEDQLSRDGGPFRPIGSVAELAALFKRGLPGPATPYGQTLMGVGTQEGANAGPPPPPARPGSSSMPPAGRPSRRPGVSPPVVGAQSSWPPAAKPPAPVSPGASGQLPAAPRPAALSPAPGVAPPPRVPAEFGRASAPPAVPRPAISPGTRASSPAIAPVPAPQPLTGMGATLPSGTSGARPSPIGAGAAPIAVAAVGPRGAAPPNASSFPPTRRSEPADRPTPVMGNSYESFASEDRKSASYATIPPGASDTVVAPQPELAAHAPSALPVAAAGLAPQAPVVPQGAVAPQAAVAPQGGVAPQAAVVPQAPVAPQVLAQPELGAALAEQPGLAQPAAGLRGRAGRAPREVLFASVPPSSLRDLPHPPGAEAPQPGVSGAAALPYSVPQPASRAGGLRWVIGFVLLGGLALLAGTVGKNYLASSATPKEAPVAPQGPGADLLSQANVALFEGRLDAALAGFEKARAASVDEAEVLLGLARVAVVKADLEALRSMLVLPADTQRVQTVQQGLAERVRDVQAALGALDKLPEGDPRRALIEVQLLGLQGRLPAAREQVQQRGLDATQPEVAYALALLDMADSQPSWSSVLGRLRIASDAEHGLGRARTARVIALVRSGDAAAAQTELEKFTHDTPQHTLLSDLSTWLTANAPAVSGTAAEGTERVGVASGTPSAGMPNADAPDPAGPGEDSRAGSEPTEAAHNAGAARQLLEEAAAARASGDLAGAKAKYERALSASPGNLAVLTGLGGVARLEGKYQEAKGYYDQVLERNPDYAAALVGGADVRWLMGNREGAAALYSRIPSGSSFYSHARRRIAEAGGNRPGAAPKEPAPSIEADKPAQDPAPAEPEQADDKQKAEKDSPSKPAAPEAEAPQPEVPAEPQSAGATRQVAGARALTNTPAQPPSE